MRSILLAAALSAALAPTAVHAAFVAITNDTYVDSFRYETTVSGAPFVIDTQRTNFGNSGAVKAVSNDGSGTQYPLTTSLVRGLFTLPASFWDAVADGGDATVSFRSRNNSLAGRGVLLHPLLQPFVAGTGGTPTNTQGGTANTAAQPIGADWLTYDGANVWTTPGGTFDATSSALATQRTTNNVLYFDWNLAPLLADPAARASVEANGLLMRVTDEATFTGNEFISLWSGNTANAPTVTFTAVPEPGVALALGGVVVLLGRKR